MEGGLSGLPGGVQGGPYLLDYQLGDPIDHCLSTFPTRAQDALAAWVRAS